MELRMQFTWEYTAKAFRLKNETLAPELNGVITASVNITMKSIPTTDLTILLKRKFATH